MGFAAAHHERQSLLKIEWRQPLFHSLTAHEPLKVQPAARKLTPVD